MARRNHVAKAAGYLLNKAPRQAKPIIKKALKQAPGRVSQGKKSVSKGVQRLLLGKRGGR